MPTGTQDPSQTPGDVGKILNHSERFTVLRRYKFATLISRMRRRMSEGILGRPPRRQYNKLGNQPVRSALQDPQIGSLEHGDKKLLTQPSSYKLL
jgi:hypothetical protein